ncbi:MAG: PDZ domain-containing protein, partial [Candidatus Eremiobacteraeota bacterium]|nr:PDZ domain-containing protein [Candidatus Eremiobacteraeota bacterium]
MSRFLRLLLTALFVVALAGVSAIVIAYKTGALARQSVLEVATTGDLRDLFSSHEPQGSMLANLALRKLESDYYKPIDPQTPISGELSALHSFLSAKKIEHPALPAETANGNPYEDGERAADVLAYAQERYGVGVGPNGLEDLTDAALRGIMSSVRDPYTVYLSPREIQGLNESLSGGNFGGIGVYIYQLKDGRIVVQPIEAMPAARAGMKPGEVVDSVNGKTVRGLNIDRVEEMIRGEAGTVVHIRAHAYDAPSAEHSYAIVREIIHV